MNTKVTVFSLSLSLSLSPVWRVNALCSDTGLQYDDLKTAMNDRATWKEIVHNISAEAAG